jgi:hypothetical protein
MNDVSIAVNLFYNLDTQYNSIIRVNSNVIVIMWSLFCWMVVEKVNKLNVKIIVFESV